jgi:hypothetical protein
MILECTYCALGSVDTMIIGLDQLVLGSTGENGAFDGGRGFVVHDVQCGFAAVLG